MEDEKIAVKCSTKEQKEEVVKYACKEEKAHYTPPDYSDCITLNKGTHSIEKWYKNNGYTIISYEDFKRDYLKKEEYPIIGEYYVSNMTGNIFRWGGKDSDYYFGGITDMPNQSFNKGEGCFIKTDVRPATSEEKLWLETCIKANKFIPKEEALKSKTMKYNFEVGKYYYFEAYNTKQPTYVKVSSIDNEGLNAEYYIYLTGKDTSNYYIGIGRWSLDQVNNPREATLSELSPYLPAGHSDKQVIKPKTMNFEVGKWYKYNGWYIKYKETTQDGNFRANESIDTNKKYSTSHYYFGEADNEKVLLTDLTEIQSYLPDGHPDKIPVLLTPEEGKWYKVEVKECVYMPGQRTWLFKSKKEKRVTYASKGVYLKDNDKFTNNAVTDDNEIVSLEPADMEEVYKYFPEEKPVTKEEEFCLKVGEEYEYGLQAGIWMVDEIGSDKIYFKSKESGRRVDYYRNQFPRLLNPTQFHLVKPKEKSMKFNIGDKVKFKTSSEYIPSYGTDHNGIPRDIIRHGSTIFKENKGEIVNTYEDWYIVSFTDARNSDVRLGFKEYVLEHYIMKEPELVEGQWYEGVPTTGDKWLFKFIKRKDKRSYGHSLAVDTISKYKVDTGWFGEMRDVKPANMEEVYKYYPQERQKEEKNIVLKKGMYLKALIDHPHGGAVKKGEYGEITSLNSDNGGYADFPSQKTYSFTHIKEEGKYELMPEGWSPGSNTKFDIGEKVMYGREHVTILGFTASFDQCVVEGHNGGHSGSNILYWFNKNGNAIPYIFGTDRYYVPISMLEKIASETPKKEKEVDYSHFATIIQSGYGMSPDDIGKRVKILKTKPVSGKIANDYYDTYWAPVEGQKYATLQPKFQYGCSDGKKTFKSEEEKEEIDIGDWVKCIGEVKQVPGKPISNGWEKDLVFKVTSITTGDILWAAKNGNGVYNVPGHVRKAFLHEIPVEKGEPKKVKHEEKKIERMWCVKRTFENKDAIIKYFREKYNKSYLGNGTYYGIRDYDNADCSAYPWGKQITTEEFYELAGISKEQKYVVAIDPYDKVEEKTVLVNLIQHKKGGILDTRVNSTYSVNEDLIKPKKVVLF